MKSKLLDWQVTVAALVSVLGAQTQGAQTGTLVAWGGQTIPWVQPGTRFTAVAAGQFHSLALTANGTVLAWGALGPAPTGLNNVVGISAGLSHDLALKSDGTVVSWGNTLAPVPAGLSNVFAIAAGGPTSLALVKSGTGLPTLQAAGTAKNFVVSWPASWQNFTLQSTTNILDSTSWTMLTDLPVVVNQQSAVTNLISGPLRFYRLTQ